MTQTALIDALDAVLPQTQCQDCQYPGCKPYAVAIALGEAPIDRCLPGGESTLIQLAALTQQDPTPLLAGMQAKAKPRHLVKIREAECIGCVKCLQACPVDAIIGAAKQMHTVIADLCTGCDLCIPPCPMDCIDTLPGFILTPIEAENAADTARKQFNAKTQRQQADKEAKQQQHQQALLEQPLPTTTIAARQQAIQAAIARTRQKKQNPHE